MRDFVKGHSDYAGDSVVPASTAFDLLEACKGIGDGTRPAPELLGDGVVIKPITADSAYEVPLSAARIGTAQSRKLIQTYLQRSSLRKQVNKVASAQQEHP